MFKLQMLKFQADKSGGFALWDTLLLVALIGALLAAAFVSQISHTRSQRAQDQDAILLWADQQVAGFAASHLRLPCPDIDNDGKEDCGSGANIGLLPVETIGLKADAAVRGPVRIRYSLLYPGSTDLTTLESSFEPQKWNGAHYNYGEVNGLDFCQKLVDIADGNADAAAYSVALKRLDGEPDLVREHSVADLAYSLSCITTMASVNGIALAVDVVNEVISEQESTHESAIITIAFNALHILLTGVDMTMAAVGLANSIATLAESAAALATAIGTCIILIGCAFIPIYAAAVASAGVAIGLFAGAIAAAAVAIGLLVNSTRLAVEVALKTGNDPGDQTLDIDPADLRDAAIKADEVVAEEQSNLADILHKRNAAETAKNNAYSTIYQDAAVADPDGDLTADVDAAVAKAEALVVANREREEMEGLRDKADNEVQNLTDALAYQQDECAHATLPEQQYKCDAVPGVSDRLATAQQNQAVAQTNYLIAVVQQTAAKVAFDEARSALENKFRQAPICALPFYPVCSVASHLEDYRKAYEKWQNAIDGYNAQLLVVQKAQDASIAAWQAYDDMLNAGAPGGGDPYNAIIVWDGAEAILRQADGKGVVE